MREIARLSLFGGIVYVTMVRYAIDVVAEVTLMVPLAALLKFDEDKKHVR